MAKDLDVVVVGGGVAGNGCCLFGQAGMSVCVLEQQHKLGGLAGAFSPVITYLSRHYSGWWLPSGGRFTPAGGAGPYLEL